jgi:hypothetical protein
LVHKKTKEKKKYHGIEKKHFRYPRAN